MATLAGLPQRPSDYSPVSRPEAALARRKYVLRRMLEDGSINNAQYKEAVAEEIKVYPREELYLQIAPYYTEQVRREIIDKYGEVSLLERGSGDLHRRESADAEPGGRGDRPWPARARQAPRLPRAAHAIEEREAEGALQEQVSRQPRLEGRAGARV